MKPTRENVRNNGQTYFLTFTTAERKPFFRHDRWAELFLDTLQRYSSADEFSLHDFVVMPDHVHLLLTPGGSLERSAQLIKGGFSFQAKRAFAWQGDIWQVGFSEHRVRDCSDWKLHIAYIEKNLRSLHREHYPFCGRAGRLSLKPAPQWLKPLD